MRREPQTKKLPWRPKNRALSELMSSYWTNFVKLGSEGPGLGKWPGYDARERYQVIHLRTHPDASPTDTVTGMDFSIIPVRLAVDIAQSEPKSVFCEGGLNRWHPSILAPFLGSSATSRQPFGGNDAWNTPPVILRVKMALTTLLSRAYK
jgi:hypothetical protein